MRAPFSSPRERLLALGAVVVIAMWALVSGIAWPLLDRLTHLQQQAFVSQQKLSRLRELARRKSAIEHAYQAHAGYRSQDADEPLQSAFLNELEQLAAGSLQMSLRPGRIVRAGSVSRLGVEVDVEATQEALLSFLDRLFTSSSLVELERLQISSSASKESPLSATFVLNKVVIHP